MKYLFLIRKTYLKTKLFYTTVMGDYTFLSTLFIYLHSCILLSQNPCQAGRQHCPPLLSRSHVYHRDEPTQRGPGLRDNSD